MPKVAEKCSKCGLENPHSDHWLYCGVKEKSVSGVVGTH